MTKSARQDTPHALSPRQMEEALKLAIRAGLVPHIQSSPGMGKTSIVERLWKVIRVQPWLFRASDSQVEDVKGVPVPIDGRLRYAISGALPQGEGRHGLFIDELKQAPSTATFNALTRLILDRSLEDYTMPRDTAIVCASNLDSDGAGTLKLPTHLRNRLCHLYLKTDYEDWAAWASGLDMEDPDPDPITIGARVPILVPPVLIAFLRTRPELLNCTLSGDDWKSKYAFNTERTWEFVARLLIAAEECPVQDQILLACISGCVGEGPALEFWGFRSIAAKAPDIDAILAGKPYAEIKDPQIAWVVTCALGQRMNRQNCQNAIDCLKKLGGEYCAMAFKMLKHGRFQGKSEELTALGKPFTDWAMWMTQENLI